MALFKSLHRSSLISIIYFETIYPDLVTLFICDVYIYSTTSFKCVFIPIYDSDTKANLNKKRYPKSERTVIMSINEVLEAEKS